MCNNCTINSKCSLFQVVKVWDFDTGRQVFEFGGTHNLSAITCMTFDPKGRRYSTWSSLWIEYLATTSSHYSMFLCLQTRHRWKRWLFKDLELQQWSVPKDTKEGYVLYIFITSSKQKVGNTILSNNCEKYFNLSCRWWMSRSVRLHLSASSQECVSNDVIFVKCSWLSIHFNSSWACAIFFWSYVMSVGRDRMIDIYPVSTKDMSSARFYLSVVCQKSHSNYFSNSSIPPSYRIPFAFVYIVITSWTPFWNSKKSTESSCCI